MKEDNRFKKVYRQGQLSGVQIWVDRKTGVNYVFAFDGYAGGLTVLVDSQGNPVVTSVSDD